MKTITSHAWQFHTSRASLIAARIAVTLALAAVLSVGAEPVRWTENGHYYEMVITEGTISWSNANAAASERSFDGIPGHLVTIASAAENGFVTESFKNSKSLPWIGGYQFTPKSEPDGSWVWVTGEPWSFTNWAAWEPNNVYGTEDYLHIRFDSPAFPDGSWNDLRDAHPNRDYIVEYEAPGDVELTKGLVGYWPFNGNSNDESGKGYHLTNNGQAMLTMDRFGNANSAYYFNGVAVLSKPYDPTSALFPTSTPFSISAWFKTTDPARLCQDLVSTHRHGVGFGYVAYVDGRYNDYTLHFYTNAQGAANHLDTTTHPVNDGQWHHFVAIRDSDAQSLFFDGNLQATIPTNGPIPYDPTIPFSVGNGFGLESVRFQGFIDDIRFYNRALTQSEVSILAEREVTGNMPPEIAQLTAPQTVEATSSNGADVDVTLTASDADGDNLAVQWTVGGNLAQTDMISGGNGSTVFEGSFPFGTTPVAVSVTDSKSDPVTQSTSVTVQDTASPTITSVSVTPNTLWPPNKKMVPVTVSVTANDNAGVVATKIISISSNEPGSGQFQITGDRTAQVQADRNGKGSGRIYTITVECKDAAGNAATATAIVSVPHDQGKK